MARALDVTDYEQVRSFVAGAVERFGRLDICIANAGGPPSKVFAETSLEDWHAAANLNLMSTVHFAREALPVMQQRRWGRFISITSVTVKQPVEGLMSPAFEIQGEADLEGEGLEEEEEPEEEGPEE